jgi:hypothetical protein
MKSYSIILFLMLSSPLFCQEDFSFSELPWFGYIIIGLFFLTPLLRILRVIKNKGIKSVSSLSRSSFPLNPKGTELSAQEMIEMQISAIDSRWHGCYIDSLETGQPTNIFDSWKEYYLPAEPESLTELFDRGDAHIFHYLENLKSTVDSGQWQECICRDFQGKEAQWVLDYHSNWEFSWDDMEKRFHFSQEDYQRGVLAWDMSRVAFLSRIAYQQGRITREKVLEYIKKAHEICAGTFQNWEELSKSYLLGLYLHPGRNGALEEVAPMVEDLLSNSKSPWKKCHLK